MYGISERHVAVYANHHQRPIRQTDGPNITQTEQTKKKNKTTYNNTNQNSNNTTTTHTFYARIINLTQRKFNKEQMHTLKLGLDYALERNPKQYLNTLIVETEISIRHLDIQLQSTFRHRAYRKIKQIAETNTCNTLHKTHRYNFRQITNHTTK
jgi:hypothetical protein